MRPSLLCTLIIASLLVHARAVEKDDGTTTSFNTTAPTDSDILGWETGWPQAGTTGWDYVGAINGGSSAVYLGNYWVMTAGHVGSGTFNLGHNNYLMVPGSEHDLTNSDSSAADIILFQISTAPSLPALSIATATPSIGASVAMLGNGGGFGETWGLNTVTENNQEVPINGFSYSFITTDFETDYAPPVNDYYLVGGDSGGGDFIYNSLSGQWELAGFNEAVDDVSHDSDMVQLSTYASEINSITGAPEPSTAVFLGLGVPALLWRTRRGRAFSGAGR